MPRPPRHAGRRPANGARRNIRCSAGSSRCRVFAFIMSVGALLNAASRKRSSPGPAPASLQRASTGIIIRDARRAGPLGLVVSSPRIVVAKRVYLRKANDDFVSHRKCDKADARLVQTFLCPIGPDAT